MQPNPSQHATSGIVTEVLEKMWTTLPYIAYGRRRADLGGIVMFISQRGKDNSLLGT